MGILLAVGVVFATPLASAFGMGVDADSVDVMKSAGATPQYAQTWAGHWMEIYGWGGFESDLRNMKAAGVTPVVMWYYYGDSISPNCVEYGCDGRTKSEWNAMAKELAQRAHAIMGSTSFYIVMEPEFQKNGIQDWETFDGYLENQANILESNAPGAKIVVGFGHWGNWEKFDRAVAAADLTGFQVLRGSTRDSTTTAVDSANYMISLTKQLKADFGKSVMVFDFGIATYGGWEWVQEKALQNVIDKRAELDAAGVKIIVWRYVYDNHHSSGYFGAAESTWGVKRADGSNKAGYNELVSLVKGSAGSTTTTTTTTSTTTTSSVFSGVKGNEWWIESKVANSPKKVEASVNGGSWVALSYKSWGAWAVSTKAPTGSVVTLRATYSDGSTKSASYLWPTATPTTSTTGTTTSTTTSTATFDASFRLVKLEEWWTQVDVDSATTIVKVDARVNGGSWIALEKKSWGDWAASFRVPSGSKVEFRATASNGATDHSSSYTR